MDSQERDMLPQTWTTKYSFGRKMEKRRTQQIQAWQDEPQGKIDDIHEKSSTWKNPMINK